MFRKSVATLLAVLFTAMSFCGEGLHLLPGLGHSLEGDAPVACHACADCGFSAEFAALPVTSHAATAGGVSRCSAGTVHGGARWQALPALRGDHDCPICQYFSQAKAADRAQPIELGIALLGESASPQPPVAAAVITPVYDTRAPPA